MDFAIVSILIFILWLAAKKTKKLLRRLEPEEKLARREVIIIKADLNGVQNTHLVTHDEPPAAEPRPADVEAPGIAFEVEPAASEPREFSWKPGEEIEVPAS